MHRLLGLDRYADYIRILHWRTVLPWILKRKGVSLGTSVEFLGAPIISMSSSGSILIGSRCVLCSNSKFTALGVNHPVIIRTLSPGAVVEIGADTGISGATICAARSVKIGNGVLIGANATIVDTDFHPIMSNNRRYSDTSADTTAAPVCICDNVFIGSGSTILKGVRIGENSVIGAGSIVTRDVPPNAIVAGNPARVLRQFAAL